MKIFFVFLIKYFLVLLQERNDVSYLRIINPKVIRKTTSGGRGGHEILKNGPTLFMDGPLGEIEI